MFKLLITTLRTYRCTKTGLENLGPMKQCKRATDLNEGKSFCEHLITFKILLEKMYLIYQLTHVEDWGPHMKAYISFSDGYK